ncbi:MAG: hypothetical protein RI891_1071, partial [Gemmatimonadota bacterium]
MARWRPFATLCPDHDGAEPPSGGGQEQGGAEGAPSAAAWMGREPDGLSSGEVHEPREDLGRVHPGDDPSRR